MNSCSCLQHQYCCQKTSALREWVLICLRVCNTFLIDPLFWQSYQNRALEYLSNGTQHILQSVCCAGLWGLDRLDGRSPMRDFKYTYDADGTGVHIYIIDTVTHPYLQSLLLS